MASLVLIPHMLAPFPRPEQFWVRPNTADIFNSGLINAGCFAIRLQECGDFLSKWHQYNTSAGAFFVQTGYQTDQQYLNWALMMVPDTLLLRNTRYNVAYWNLHDRNLRVDYSETGQPIFSVDHQPLAFFHFSGYNINDRLTLSRHDGRCIVYDIPAVAEILNWFSDAVLSTPTVRLLDEDYAFDRWANGFTSNRFIREVLKRYEPYLPHLDIRTAEGADQLCAILMDPLPATGSMLPLVSAEIYNQRPDLQGAFPKAHTDCDVIGFWFWFCRHAGREFNIDFLINNFRRILLSNSLIFLVDSVATALGVNPPLRLLSVDRYDVAERLQATGRGDLADTLLEGRAELSFFTEIGAILSMYEQRPDLQKVFPDILGENHDGFIGWLANRGWLEQGIPEEFVERFAARTAAMSLSRIYSYLARRSDLIDARCESLLLDDLDPILRELIRGSGEGLEYDLDDLVILRYIHHNSRHLLVPLYLELPYVRRRADASRLMDKTTVLLPESVRLQRWAARGCKTHHDAFNRLSSMLDEQLRSIIEKREAMEVDVAQLLRKKGKPVPAIGLHPDVRFSGK